MLDNVYGVLGFQYLQLLEGHYHLECMQSLSNISNTNNISDLYFSFKVRYLVYRMWMLSTVISCTLWEDVIKS